MVRQAMPVQTGKVIDYTNSGAAAISVGDVVPLVNMCGIAEIDIPVGATGTVAIYGVWELAAETSVAFAVGDTVYWDATNKRLTKTATSNVFFGVAVAPKDSAGATARCKIGFIAPASSGGSSDSDS